MQINNQNNISFGTNIKFVSPGCFRRVTKKMTQSKECKYITDWHIKGSPAEIGYCENMNLGMTGGIKSCTAGVVVKKGENAPLFWHIWDIKENLDDMPVLEEKFKGDNAVIIGSKSAYYYSKKLCNKFQKLAYKKNIPTTVFRSMAFRWKAYAAYTSNDDTLYLCVQHCDKPYKYVKSMKDLKETFNTVQVSPTDNIEFIKPIKGLFITGKVNI